jgi:hypothetical protein
MLQVGWRHQVMTLYLTNIARVYENMREWQKAMEFHLRVIDVAIAGGGGARSLEVSVALEDIAYCYIEKGLGMDCIDHDQIVIRGSLNFLLRSFDISFSMYVLLASHFRPHFSPPYTLSFLIVPAHYSPSCVIMFADTATITKRLLAISWLWAKCTSCSLTSKRLSNTLCGRSPSIVTMLA